MKNIEIDPFWETKTLDELSPHEWEALCDGCGLCCLNRLQDADDDEAPIYLTRVACHCYDIKAQQCSDYANRFDRVEGCMRLTVERVAEFDWLPDTCAYRLRYALKPLPSWHPLITKDPRTVREHGMYALNPVLDSEEIELEDYIVEEEIF